MRATTHSGSDPTRLRRQLAKGSVAAPVIAWVLGLCFSNPDPHLVPAKVIADVIRTGFFAAGGVFALLVLVEIAFHGTRGILLAGLVGLGFNSLGIMGAYRNLPDEIRIYRAGNAATDLQRVEGTLDFQNLANPNLLKDKPALEAQRARLEKFLVTAKHSAEVMEPGKQVIVRQTMGPAASPDQHLDVKVRVIQDMNAKLELCDRELKLAEAAANLLDLLIQDWGHWKMPAGRFDPEFDLAENARTYKSMTAAMLSAEQGLARQQQLIFGQATIHPGERIVSVTNLKPSLQVQARTLSTATSVAARVAPATFPNVIDYAKLDFDNPAEAAPLPASQTLSEEDASVMQAWGSVLSNLVAAAREVDRTAKALAAADILNGATVIKQGPVPVSEQFVNRRKIANAYGSAVNAWQQRLSGLSGQYLGALYQSNVSPERAQVERELLSAAIDKKLKLQLKICAAESDVALGYNRTVSSLEMYQQYVSFSQPTPAGNQSTIPTRKLPWETPDASNPAVSQSRQQLAEQTAKLDTLKRSVQQLRQQKTE